MAIVYPEINCKALYADYASGSLIKLKESLQTLTAEKLFAHAGLTPACRLIYLPSVSYLGLLIAGTGYMPANGSYLKKCCFQMAASEQWAPTPDENIYCPQPEDVYKRQQLFRRIQYVIRAARFKLLPGAISPKHPNACHAIGFCGNYIILPIPRHNTIHSVRPPQQFGKPFRFIIIFAFKGRPQYILKICLLYTSRCV